ncbi:MAG: c-type cytochrome [Bacteroidia bacterium]|nr:c-type cytochrome [Bacteroidia bacterium]
MEIGILHTHVLVVSLFTLLLLIKTGTLVSKKLAVLEKINAKTKIVSRILESLMLGTGIFLVIKSPLGFHLLVIVKLLLMILGVVLGVLAFKKNQAGLAVLSLILFAYIFGISRTHSLTMASTEHQIQRAVSELPANATSLDKGKAIYTTECIRCHGPNGDSNYRKAKNLRMSVGDDNYKAAVIKNGMKLMPAYPYLNESETKAVIEYINTFKQ